MMVLISLFLPNPITHSCKQYVDWLQFSEVISLINIHTDPVSTKTSDFVLEWILEHKMFLLHHPHLSHVLNFCRLSEPLWLECVGISAGQSGPLGLQPCSLSLVGSYISVFRFENLIYGLQESFHLSPIQLYSLPHLFVQVLCDLSRTEPQGCRFHGIVEESFFPRLLCAHGPICAWLPKF